MLSSKRKSFGLFFYIVKFKEKIKNITLLFFLFAIASTYNIFIKNDIKVCLCVIAKNEKLYIREFVKHYQKIGYNNIIIYDNNDEDCENIEEEIKDYIETGFVKIINFKKNNPNIIPQTYAYKDCYAKYNKLYDWLSFFDVDEFLEINKKYYKIQDFLKDKIFKRCKNIKINWLRYSNTNLLYYENKPLQERIKQCNYSHFDNKLIKSTIRGNLSLNYWQKMSNPHTSLLNYISCSSSGKKIKYDSPFNNPPDYTNALLKHYSYKSFEEYCLKLKRGRADTNKYLGEQIFKSAYKKLIMENQGNLEKLNIIHKILKV